jgi:cytochrome c-type biogenesis protein CcmE
MTRKQTRLSIILASIAALGTAVGIMLYAAGDTIVFFYTPSEIASKALPAGTRIRLGGLVEKGSFKPMGDAAFTFSVTDMTQALQVTYKGQLPDLFREGQGVVAEGLLKADGSFSADTVLAKHDENYMPKDIADKLKEQGVWKDSKAVKSEM